MRCTSLVRNMRGALCMTARVTSIVMLLIACCAVSASAPQNPLRGLTGEALEAAVYDPTTRDPLTLSGLALQVQYAMHYLQECMGRGEGCTRCSCLHPLHAAVQATGGVRGWASHEVSCEGIVGAAEQLYMIRESLGTAQGQAAARMIAKTTRLVKRLCTVEEAVWMSWLMHEVFAEVNADHAMLPRGK